MPPSSTVQLTTSDGGLDLEAVALVVDATVERTTDHDLPVTGATREGLLQGAVPVAERAESTALVAEWDLGVTSRLRWE